MGGGDVQGPRQRVMLRPRKGPFAFRRRQGNRKTTPLTKRVAFENRKTNTLTRKSTTLGISAQYANSSAKSSTCNTFKPIPNPPSFKPFQRRFQRFPAFGIRPLFFPCFSFVFCFSFRGLSPPGFREGVVRRCAPSIRPRRAYGS